MSRNWTEKQRDAIESREGSILVSAAAGSGKTAVLVERVIRRITDENNPCPADRLLIVTFTKAAANEMRERIASSLEQKVRENPQSSYFTQQQMLLPDAKICTIDSFCNLLVKENFHALGISPEYRIADETELRLLEQEAVSLTLEDFYKEGDKDFLDLVELLFKGRDDSELALSVIELFHYSRAYPFPEKWLDNIEKGYDPLVPIKDSPFGQIILDYVSNAAKYCLSLVTRMRITASENEYMREKYTDYINETEVSIRSFLEKAESGQWDSAVSLAENCIHKKPSAKRGTTGDSDEITVKSCHDAIKDTFSKVIIPKMCVTEDENREDNEKLLPSVRMIIKCVKAFSQKLIEIKRAKGCFDFSDISHMALSLLVRDKDGEPERTELAKELSERYAEILIDEYQDTNVQQDMLFTAVSKNGENLFRVGDVKQCIYAFRQAMPDIFISIREKLGEFHGQYPAKITLDRNFRSRKGVTSYINFVFSQLMSSESANIEYGESEALVPRASYEETSDPQAEFHIIDLGSENIDMGTQEAQANYIASLIKKMVIDGRMINDNGQLRKIKYKDICILMRAVSSSGIVFANVMREWEIPCFTDISEDFFSAPEVGVMLSLLRVIDNPAQDIPLMSVMLSPIFSFSPDEMTQIRVGNRKESLYARLLSVEGENEKVAAFLKFFRRMRFIAATSSSAGLIRRIYEETAYTSIVQAMKNGDIRKGNLMLLIDYAETYEKNGNTGLSGFIRFIDRLCENRQKLDASNLISESADVVRIMTIHKSKGLEFPVCILARADKDFNEQEENGNIVFNQKHGFGLKRRDVETLSEYETLSRTASKIALNVYSRQEEMRVLYVAMTRAKEDLIIVTSVKNVEDKVQKLSSDIDLTKKQLQPFSVLSRKKYSDWLIKTLMRHKDCGELRRMAGIDSDYVIKSDFDLRLQIVKKIPEPSFVHTTEFHDDEISESFQRYIDEKVKYKYKYSSLIGIPTKRAASELKKEFIDRENFAQSKPAFMQGEELTASQKGTAMHLFFQRADFERALNDVESEINRLREENRLSELQAKSINRRKAAEFFESSLCKRIIRSETVLREKKFTVEIPIEKMYPDINDGFGEKVMIMGIIDCAFLEDGEWVLVDYKTDRVKSGDELRERYTSQLSAYKYALEMITPYKVREAYLYSFALSEPVKLDIPSDL